MAKKRSLRSRRRRQREMAAFIALAFLALALVGAILFLAVRAIRTSAGDSTRQVVVRLTAEPTMAPEAAATISVQSTTASVFETVTDAPSGETAADVLSPQVTQAPAAPAAVSETPAQDGGFQYLPVVTKGSNTKKWIAITVDDCFQMGNLKKICQWTVDNGGRITIFPIGENVVRDGMADILKKCVEAGFEIENHTWSHARIFRLSEEEMATEIWKQSAALNRVLGVNYHQHFFRLMGGDGEHDQRTHNYLKQLGFLGVASWTFSGSDSDLPGIKERLAPGTIYLFHTTDKDTANLKEFIPYAVRQGYELVTLNEILGYPSNEVTDLSTFPEEMPAPQPYTVEYRELKNGDYGWDVLLLQQKLLELGYLDKNAKSAVEGTPADGDFGPGTAKAVQAFQKASGLEETGVADVATQELLFSK